MQREFTLCTQIMRLRYILFNFSYSPKSTLSYFILRKVIAFVIIKRAMQWDNFCSCYHCKSKANANTTASYQDMHTVTHLLKHVLLSLFLSLTVFPFPSPFPLSFIKLTACDGNIILMSTEFSIMNLMLTLNQFQLITSALCFSKVYVSSTSFLTKKIIISH